MGEGKPSPVLPGLGPDETNLLYLTGMLFAFVEFFVWIAVLFYRFKKKMG